MKNTTPIILGVVVAFTIYLIQWYSQEGITNFHGVVILFLSFIFFHIQRLVLLLEEISGKIDRDSK